MDHRRRKFCVALAAASLVPTPLFTRKAHSSNPGAGSFQHGVASGDPLHSQVIIWTRITQADLEATIPVSWVVAQDPAMQQIVHSGSTTTTRKRDFTVKVDVAYLSPGTTYYYQFSALGKNSPVGRTRTFPDGSPDRMRIGVASCSHYSQGYFNAYKQLAQRTDLDAVLHLGDYIYEFSNDTVDGSLIGRSSLPNAELISAHDYRQRYAQYRTDPDLQEVHRQHPFIAVWDDHEFAADAWMNGSKNHNADQGEGPWFLRKYFAALVYLEWMPIRESGWENGVPRIYRTFRFGDLADLNMLDTRMVGRDEQIPTYLGSVNKPDRHILGKNQEQWLFGKLSNPPEEVQWRLIGQQVMFSQFTADGKWGLRKDHWDGYPAARDRLLNYIQDNSLKNIVFLTGDFHSSWANEVSLDPFDPQVYDPASSDGALAVEFLTPGITGEFPAFLRSSLLSRDISALNPHIKYIDLQQRGYMLIDVDRDRVQAEWYYVDTVVAPSPNEVFGGAFKVAAGTSHLTMETSASPPGLNTAKPAPLVIA